MLTSQYGHSPRSGVVRSSGINAVDNPTRVDVLRGCEDSRPCVLSESPCGMVFSTRTGCSRVARYGVLGVGTEWIDGTRALRVSMSLPVGSPRGVRRVVLDCSTTTTTGCRGSRIEGRIEVERSEGRKKEEVPGWRRAGQSSAVRLAGWLAGWWTGWAGGAC
jgi:hypothetical protein